MSLSFAFLCFPFSAVPLSVSFPDLLLSCPAYFLLIFFLPFPFVFPVLSSTKSFPFLPFLTLLPHLLLIGGVVFDVPGDMERQPEGISLA